MRKQTDLLLEKERRIAAQIRDIPVPQVPQDEIKAVCRTAASYYVESPGIWTAGFWRSAFSFLTVKAVVFWLLAAFLLGSCVVPSMASAGMEVEPLAFLTSLSPVPMLTFVIRELQCRDSSLVQLEKTCRYAPGKIYFARLWIGMIFNALLVGLAGAAFPHSGFLLKAYLCAFTAMFLAGAAALFLVAFLDNALPLSLIMAAWVLGASWILSQCEVLDVIMGADISIGILVCAAVFGLGLFAVSTVKTAARLYA